ncbi:MAG: 2-oxoacid:acceptor oxidoreductase subunit alpha [Candidatus Doudnabacteria bacterium]|nr:2-oxoacid:acceptor oxidoreductase subunit alpha [Candidatus Doudnabacteria bacterium]
MSERLVTIKIGGEAGFGIKVAGSMLGKIFSRMGYQVFDYTEYPSLIRGGHNTFEITIGEKVHHHIRPVNLLVALNQQTFDEHQPELSKDAGIIYDPGKVKNANAKFTLFAVPFSQITRDVGGSELMKNTVALGALLAVLGANIEGLLSLLRETFGSKGQPVIDMNLKAGSAGYDFAKKNFKNPFAYKVENRPPREQIYVTGNEAVGMGAIAAGCRAYFGYPMTPSSSLLEFVAKNGPKFGMIVRQPEDEIAVLNSAIGAGWMGTRSMVGTSGGGFSLMTEALGLSGITETPVVIFMGQRPGPATGLPTWSGQADLRFLMHAAQDEFPRMIIAPGDQEECFYLTAEAFNWAEKYQMPVFLLSDKNLAEGGKTVPVFDQAKVQIDRGEWVTAEDIKKQGKYLRYKVTESGVSPRALPGTEGGVHLANSDEHDEYGYNVEDVANRNAQMQKRMRKLDNALLQIPDPKLYGPDQADLTIVSWGSTKGPILQALADLSLFPSPSTGEGGRRPDEGGETSSVNFLHFNYVWPFPTPRAVMILEEAKQLLVVENNFSGQFEGLIRQQTGIIPGHHLRKYDGRPFWPEEIVEKVKNILG